MHSIAAYYVVIATNQERRAVQRGEASIRPTLMQRVRALFAGSRSAPAAAGA